MANALLKEDGGFLLKEDGFHILLDPTLTTSLATSPDVRITVYDHAGGLLQLNAGGDFAGGHIQYENTPWGCGAATLQAGVLWEDAIAKGYYAARNIIEISTADDALTAACAAGATKLYVTSNTAYAGTFEPDAQQVYLYDGGQLVMRIPVTGTGSDAGGPFITVGSPAAGGGNPTTLPAMPLGTLIGRRRWSGEIIKRGLENSKLPKTMIYCGSLTQRLDQALGTFTISLSAAVDIGTACYNIIKQFSARWPEFTISAGNFASIGKNAAGTYDRQTVKKACDDLLNQVTSGDVWHLYVGHDRTVRVLRLYTSSSNTYAYNQTLNQGVQSFEAVGVKNDDQDGSQLFNSFEVIGDTDPVTKQPVRGIYQDATSIGLYGQIDAAAVTNVGCKTAAQCADLALAIANAQSVARQNGQVRIYIDEPGAGPLGLTQGDIISGVTNVTVANFEGSAPNIYGLCMSAITTLDAAQGYRYQDIKFSAVEPDWNAAMAERGNALATALKQNTRTGVAVDQYCVSVDAFPASGIPTSGLNVNPPTFLALFLPGSAIATITNPTFACVANATNWAWLNPNATWTVKQDPSPVSGAILFAIFMCNGTNVIGQFQRAPVGVMRIGVGNINVASGLVAPTTSGTPAAANVATPTTLAADVSVTCTVTNVPQDGSAFGLAYYYRTSGQTAWVPYDEQNLAGLPNPAATQTMPAMVLGQLQNGITYDFGIGYVGLAGYGPVTRIITSFVAASIVVTTPYIIGTTSPTPTVTTVTATGQTSANGLAAAMRLQFTLTNQPTDGSLSRISIWFRVNGSTPWTFYTSLGVPGLPTPSASQAYDITLADLTNGQNYDFAVSYENAQGQDSAVFGTIATNVAAATINLPATGLPSIPGGMSFVTTGAAISGYTATTSGAYGATVSIPLVLTNGGTPANWLGQIDILTAPTGTTNWSVNTFLVTNSTATAVYTLDGLGAGQAYDIAVRLDSLNPASVSAIVSTGLTTVAQLAGGGSLQTMPASIKTNGPTLSPAPSAPTWTTRRGMFQSVSVSFTETDFTAKPNWIDKIILAVRVNGDTSDGHQYFIDPGISSTGTYTHNVLAHSGDTLDIGIAYSDIPGQISTIVWPANWSASADPQGTAWDGTNPAHGNHGRASTGTQTLVRTDGGHNATDFQGVIELAPTDANAGLWYTNGNSVCWDKAATVHNLTNGPATYTMVGYSTAFEFSFWFLADAHTANSDPSNGYLVQGNATTVTLYKRVAGADTSLGVISGAGNLFTAQDNSLEVTVQNVTGIGNLFSLKVNGTSKNLVDAAAARTTGYYGVRNLGSNTYIRHFLASPSYSVAQTANGVRPRRNIVVNGNNSSGSGSIPPTTYGWSASLYNTATALISSGTFAGDQASLKVTKGTSEGGFYQDLILIPGRTYTCCMGVSYDTVGMNPRMWLGVTNYSARDNTTVLIPSGLPGVFYTRGATVMLPGNTDAGSAGVNTAAMLYFTFVAVRVTTRLLLYDTSNVAGSMYINGVMICEGDRLQDYVDHELNTGAVHADRHLIDGTTRSTILVTETVGAAGSRTVKQLNDGTRTRTAANVAAIVDANGNVPNTTPFTTNVPNSLYSLVPDVSLQYSVTAASGTGGSMRVWMANAAGNSTAQWIKPDGTGSITSTAGNNGSGAAPLLTTTGLATGDVMYYVSYFDTVTGTFSITGYKNVGPTLVQIAAAIADKGTNPILYVTGNNTVGSGVTVPSTLGTTTGGVRGGGGPPLK